MVTCHKVVTCQQGQVGVLSSGYHIALASTLNCSAVSIFFVAPSQRPSTTARGAERACAHCTLITIVSNSRRCTLSLRLPRSLSPPLFRSTWQRSAAEDCAIAPESELQRSCHACKQFPSMFRFVLWAARVLWGKALLFVCNVCSEVCMACWACGEKLKATPQIRDAS
jgi:hypothetical protein